METREIDTATRLLLASTLSATSVGRGISSNAGTAILESVLDGRPIPPDYWPELQECTNLLRELTDLLEESP